MLNISHLNKIGQIIPMFYTEVSNFLCLCTLLGETQPQISKRLNNMKSSGEICVTIQIYCADILKSIALLLCNEKHRSKQLSTMVANG